MSKLYKSRKDRMVAGVAGGLAEYFNVDSTIIRFLFALSMFFGGAGFWIYIILAIVMPDPSDRSYDETDKKSPTGRPMHDARPTEDKSRKEDNWSDF